KELESASFKPRDDSDYETLSMDSIALRHPKSIGAEHIALSAYLELGFDQIFKELGFKQKHRHEAILSILGRMLDPGSENSTVDWARQHTGLDALLDIELSKLSHNALYRITDYIYRHKDYIEQRLTENERGIFNLEEKIVLYDLTNTYFEGISARNHKARFGRSKEKRSDCRLLTLGLVLDEMGFPKRSKVMEGSVSEPGTLKSMIDGLHCETGFQKPVTVVIDAGISSQSNLDYIRERGMNYICVARNKPIPDEWIDDSKFVDIPNKGNNKIVAQSFQHNDECILFCNSEKMADKEQAMKKKFCEGYEAELDKLHKSLSSKNTKRKLDYIRQREGRLRERFKSVSMFYTVHIDHTDDKATGIRYECDLEAMELKYSGSYFLRTSLMNISETELWDMYMMLNTVESAFRTLKSDLNLRPVYHQKESRSEAHLFIAVLAYHIVNAIRIKLKDSNINLSWTTLRRMMRSHIIASITMQNKEGRNLSIRLCSNPDENHREIYKALDLNHMPLPKRVSKF
ncbi:MAG TPA: IS1634 family transposase, partial [Candidatus Cloacimonadota bacterium]|nr:IS1634 family transposase [Candidatus Cloacimonadota bacterium]